jgi:hypothetical protein
LIRLLVQLMVSCLPANKKHSPVDNFSIE